VDIDDVARLAEDLAGVRRTARDELAEWRYHGRLIARQLDDVHLVIRADFRLPRPRAPTVSRNLQRSGPVLKHMMVVADLVEGDADAIEDALEAAWQLQRSSD
jgi:hypothetical protein